MSSPKEPVDNTKPVVKEKNPHNYRKVGFSMIAVSVSLVLIALLVWSVGDNYHFASDIMAAQEMDAMTPKQGFNVIYFDEGQPVGGKFKILDHAGTIARAHELQAKYAKQYEAEKGQVIVFDATIDDNKKLVEDLRAAALANTQAAPKTVSSPTTSAQPVITVNATGNQTNQTTITLSESVGINASNPSK